MIKTLINIFQTWLNMNRAEKEISKLEIKNNPIKIKVNRHKLNATWSKEAVDAWNAPGPDPFILENPESEEL